MKPDLIRRIPASCPTRRAFLIRLSLAPGTLAARSAAPADSGSARRLRFGLISDVHHDVMPDGLDRIGAFVAAMERAKPDFVLQLGDFCCPAPRNQAFIEAWNRFGGQRFHVLGNHDMDGSFTREQTVAYYGMPHRHYTFLAGPVRGIVLDGNEPGGQAKGYRRFMGADQLAWLERQLAESDRPVVLFIHQPFDADHGGCLENSAAVRAAVERAEASEPGRVIAVFSGHLHLDYARVVNGIRHVQINSASYWWLESGAARRETFPAAVHQKHPYLTHVAAYREPLWALASLDLEQGELVVEGRRTEWVGPDPWERGEQTTWSRDDLHPGIADRRLRVPRHAL